MRDLSVDGKCEVVTFDLYICVKGTIDPRLISNCKKCFMQRYDTRGSEIIHKSSGVITCCDHDGLEQDMGV